MKTKTVNRRFPILKLDYPAAKNSIVICFFTFTLFLYIKNVTRDIYSGDVGDLVTAAYVFGVAHPPGYPLFTVIGHLLTYLPFGIPVVTKVAMLSVFSAFFGIILYYRFSLLITNSIFISILSSSILSFSYLYWFHAELPEVFALHHFFVIAIVYFSFLFYKHKKIVHLYILSFMIGLSITHHHTIIFVFPLVIILISKHIKLLMSIKTILTLFLVFILGLLPYIYVPIAASYNPPINWDTPTNIQNFVRLILRKDYGTFGSSILPLFGRFIVVGDYITATINGFSYQGIFLILSGMVYLFIHEKRVLFALTLSFLLSGPLFVFYTGPVILLSPGFGIIERFYTYSSILLTFFLPFGLLYIKKFLDTHFSKSIYSFVILSYFFIIPIFMVWYNLPRTDLSSTQIGNNLSNDILSSLPQNSILFVSGDTTTFNIWYSYYVLGYRNDIDIINPFGVGGNNFLEEQVKKYYKINKKTNFKEFIPGTIAELKKTRRVFGTYEFRYRPDKTSLLPNGLVFELVDTDRIPVEEKYLEHVEKILKTYHIKRNETLLPSERGIITSEIPLIYSNALVRIGDFVFSYYKNPQKAEHYYRRALWINDENPAGYSGLGLSLYRAYNDCRESITNMKKAKELYPVWETYFLQLYLLHKGCKTDKKEMDKVSKEYALIFKKNIEAVTKNLKTNSENL